MNMLRGIAFVVVILLACSAVGTAGPGDTLVVQTFTWGWPTNPGWLAPKEGRFFFPTAEKRFEKILLYYTLKCDPAQNPACGEWDYLTYTRLHEHTGVYDSTQLTHPNFTVFGATVDTLRYMNAPSYAYYPRLQRSIRYTDTLNLDLSVLGNGTVSSALPFGAGAEGARSYVLWSRSELEAAGSSSDTLTAMRFKVQGQGGGIARFTLRLKRFTGAGWTPDIPTQGGMTTVYDGALTLPDDAWVTVHFTQPFIIWGGGVLAELSVEGAERSVTLAGDALGDQGFAYASTEADGFLDFRQRSFVNCGDMPELNATESFTLEAWFRPEQLRDWSDIVMRAKDSEHRIGIQLGPPENGRADVYCLVGNGSNSYGYSSTKPAQHGKWTHVAMVYDARENDQARRLRLLVNGTPATLKFNGTIPSITADIEAPFRISGAGTNSMNGAIDEVRVWRTALSNEDILARMHTQVTAADPLFTQLIAGWDCNAVDNGTLRDVTGAHDGRLLYPLWRPSGADRARGYVASTTRPAVVIERGSFVSRIDQVLIIDTVAQPPLLVTRYADTSRANIPTDTLLVWPVEYSYSFNADGTVRDSVPRSPDGMLTKELHFYYGTPFEKIINWELGRYITPYGIGLSLGEGWTWVYDVTDFAPLLKDSVHLTAGNFQELLDMKFVFIEGTPPRDVVELRNVWQGDFSLKNFTRDVAPKTFTLHPDAKSFKLRTTVTGHQFSNATNCAEFCPKIHSVLVDGQVKWNWQIIQECSMNPLYPQGGTWIYARAGWCPGMEGMIKEFELTPYVTGSTVNIDYESQYDEFGNYVMESQLVSYTAPNHRLDAAIERIVTPSDDMLQGRFNPSCGRPRIVLRNRGADVLSSVDIRYGVRGGESRSYTWRGSLGFMEQADVWLPPLGDMGGTGANVFEVSLSNPNGGSDEYSYNDRQWSGFESVPVYDQPLIVIFRTNNAPGENSYEILDAEGTSIYSRSGFIANATYRDTLRLLPGCYEFLLHDSGEDGISWWANNDGAGSLQFRLLQGELWKTMQPDFGKQSRYPFRYSSLVSTEAVALPGMDFSCYPNPATERLSLRFGPHAGASLRYVLVDLLGREVLHGTVDNTAGEAGTLMLDVSALQPGMYVAHLVQGARILASDRVTIVK